MRKMRRPLIPASQLDHGDPARRDVESNAVCGPGLFLDGQRSIRSPLISVRNSSAAQTHGHTNTGAAIDLGHSLLRLEHAVVVKECHYPSARRAIAHVFDVAFDANRRRFTREMSEQVGHKRSEAFVFAQEVRQSDEDHATAAEFVYSDERIAGGYRHQDFGALCFDAIVAKYLSAQILFR